MNEVLLNKIQRLKFRQWSGKNYAVFVSLGKEVNIGHIDVDICDKASEKSNQTKSLTSTNREFLIEDLTDQEKPDEENLEFQLISVLAITSIADKSLRHCRIILTKYLFNYVTSCKQGAICYALILK